MSELFKVYFLSSTTRTCFFYLNETELEKEKWVDSGIKIQYGSNFENFTYGSISFQSLAEVPNKCIGITSLLGNRLGLRENDEVFVTPCVVDSVNSLEISPKREEDYVILLSCKSILESHLLNQVHVVAEGQSLPLYVFTNIVIDVEIGKLQSKSNYGKLEKFTEITIIHPSERPKKLEENSTIENSDNKFQDFFNSINKTLEEIHPSVRYNEITDEEIILRSILDNKKKSLDYEIKPSFLLKSDIPEKIKNKFIIVSNFEKVDNLVGPICAKVFVRVQKTPRSSNENEEEENIKLNTIVVSLNDSKKKVAYCPGHIMKKLKVFVGSHISIERVKPDLGSLLPWKVYNKQELEKCWSSLAEIREKVKNAVVNNIKHDHKINCLVVGGLGTGKTFLLQDIVNEFSDDFIYCKFINCKSLRGKKMDSLLKLWNEYMKECVHHEPSLLILDDLHALTYIDDEEGQFNKLYSNRVVNLISWCIKEHQERHNVSVIASAANMSQLANFVTTHGPRLFENVHIIPEMNSSERFFAVENLINRKVKSWNKIDIKKIAESTNGYTIQDLNDLVEKSVFNYLLRVESPCDEPTVLNQSDFDSVLSETVPSALQNVKLRDNIEKKWEDVGGMTEAKKTLTEVFSWPSKYPKLLESCPLRLQKGVLLYGAPGTGKTILAGALANKCGLNFISVKGPEILSKYVGASEEGVRNLFQRAQKTHPCLLFFDEFDSLAPQRGHDNTGVTDRVVNQLLTQLDGVEALDGVWVLAATSRPDLIDPALLRPGRLDKMVYCGIPNKEDRLSILKALSRNLPATTDVDFDEIADKTEGYTGADIQAVLYNAQMSVVKNNLNLVENGVKPQITQEHLLSAVSDTKPSLSTFEKLKYEKLYERFLDSRKQGSSKNYEKVQKVTFA